MLLSTISLTPGCATKNNGDFCDVVTPLRPSVDDKLTAGTSRQILKIDRYGTKACGWKP